MRSEIRINKVGIEEDTKELNREYKKFDIRVSNNPIKII